MFESAPTFLDQEATIRKIAKSFNITSTAHNRTCEFVMPTGPLLPSSHHDFSGHECSFLQEQGNSYACRRLYNGIVSRIGMIQRQVMNPRSKLLPFQDPNGSKYEYRSRTVSGTVIVSLREQVNTRLSRGLEIQSFLLEKCRRLEATDLYNRSKPLVLRNLAIHFSIP